MKNITAVILAGGESKRMGRDKAFLKWKGKTFLRNILESVDKFSDQIIISGNKAPEIYLKEASDLKNIPLVIKDINPFAGPLNGIASCADYIKNENILLITCDTPILNRSIINYLYKSLKNHHCVIPIINGKFQPFNTFYKKIAFLLGKEFYKKGTKSLYKWIENLDAKFIKDEELRVLDEKLLMFKSINTPEEYVTFINTLQN